MLPKPIDLSEEQIEAIDKCLEHLHWETDARCVLLADITGQLISGLGASDQMNTAVLSALAAGEIAATKEMANLVGEQARFRMVLHEGLRNSVYLSDVGEEMLLITVFETQTPIGMVRLFTKEVVADLIKIIAQSKTPGAQNSAERAELDGFDSQFFEKLDASLSEDWQAE
ncbi:MAG: roadblock/LC7 domain-containing protein [Anaerolineae bacterium]|nr:roadblock/LC7 domain-containing protein [Anaerolineae bacterium]